MSEQGERGGQNVTLVAAGTCGCARRLRAEAEATQPQPGANMPHPDLVARAHRAAWYRDAARWLEMQDYRDANRASERKEDA